MEQTADELATWKATDFDFERIAHMMFNASICQHLANLDATSLEALGNVGTLLVDEAKLLARDFSYDAVYVLTDVQVITEQDELHWNFPRFTPDFMFSGLKEFVLIQRHMLRLPPDNRTWHDLTHAERLRVAIGYVNLLAPLGRYMAKIQRRSRSEGRRSIAALAHTPRTRRLSH